MSIFYYMAATREMPTGSFGHSKTTMTIADYLANVNPQARDQPHMQVLLEKYSPDAITIDVYETELDAAGIYVSGPLGREQGRHIFSNPVMYQVNPEGGSFRLGADNQRTVSDLYERNKKCVTELFAYLDRNMEAGDEVELYSCWADGPERFYGPRIQALDLTIHLSAFDPEEPFEWKERQRIIVRK
ncbi:hypothetical protein ACFFK0_11545 [Paenibacillus chartarius]|uniref:Uncharacterized protein n=1 Tax=Paenibacillus chartarius TaxID=747481 RepID=A0ABV6DKC6_9BACL